MAGAVPDVILEAEYAEYAREYLRRLPLEHFMEAKAQAVQRAITLASFALVVALCPEVHLFNEMLVQYPRPRRRRPGQVVPDNMVVIYSGTLDAEESYDVPLQPARPFWVMEYVSRRSRRKDYEDSFKKYERELQVPYCLMFRPEKQQLDLFKHDGRRYVRVEANLDGRYTIADLDMEVGLLSRWVRFWHRGQLLPLPAEIQARLAQEKRRANALQRQVAEERKARLAAERELARLRAEQPKKPS